MSAGRTSRVSETSSLRSPSGPARSGVPLVRRGRHRSSAGPIDALDVAIVAALRDDGRASLRRVARRVGASVTTVSTRVRALERLGVLQGFVPLVSARRLAAIGRSPHCVVLHITPRDASRVGVEALARAIARDPNVCYLFEMAGSSELMALASTDREDETHRLIEELRALPYVLRVRPVPILEVYKERPGHPIGAPAKEADVDANLSRP